MNFVVKDRVYVGPVSFTFVSVKGMKIVVYVDGVLMYRLPECFDL